MIEKRTIDAGDLDRLLVSDDPGEVVKWVTDVAMKRFGLTYGANGKPRWWLGESARLWWRRWVKG
jgi:hypothetical protein